MTRSEQREAHGLQWTYRSLAAFRRRVLRRREEERLLVLQMPREAFSEHMGLRGASGQKTGGWDRQGAGAQAKEQRVGLIHSSQNTSRSPTLCQVLLQPWGAEQGTSSVHRVVRELDSEEI